MPDAAIILINGYPGVGKFACAMELEKLLPNARVLDMHQLDIAALTLHQTSAQSDELRFNLRKCVLDSLFATPPSEVCPTIANPPLYILTDTLFTCQPTRHYQDLYLAEAHDHRLPLLHLILTCSTDANIARLTDPTRLSLKDHDESHVMETRMTSEIAHFVKPQKAYAPKKKTGLAPVEGLAGEFEVDSTNLDVYHTASIFAEYVQEALRAAGWYFRLKRPPPRPFE